MTLIVAPSIAVRKQCGYSKSPIPAGSNACSGFEEIKTHFQSSALGSVLEYASNKHISTDMIKMLLRHHIM